MTDSGTVVLGEDWTDAEEVKLPHELLAVEDAHRAASVYVAQGWAVTAGPGLDATGRCSCHLGAKCRNAGKHAHKGWNNEKRKTLNQSQIDKWWSHDNPAWRTRPVDQVFLVPYLSGLVVMDVDRMDEWEALDPSERPETLWASSGSGRGGHYFYEYQWDTDAAMPPLLPGKIKGGSGEIKFRGIVAACPSVHRNGGRYMWQNWGTPVAPVPERLLVRGGGEGRTAVLKETIPVYDTTNRFLVADFMRQEDEIDSLGDVTTGRPVVLFPVAASCMPWILGGWITEEEVIDRLLRACEKNGLVRDYGEADIMRQIKNGLEAGRAGE